MTGAAAMTPATIETVEQLYKSRVTAALLAIRRAKEHGLNDVGQAYEVASAIRDHDERAGLVTMPREPTDAMVAAGYVLLTSEVGAMASEVWPAMVSASPFASAAQGEGGE